jgi:hypothetical protein
MLEMVSFMLAGLLSTPVAVKGATSIGAVHAIFTGGAITWFFGHQLVHRKKACFAPAIPRTLRHILGHFKHLRHGEGVLQAEHWLRLAKAQLLKGRD